MRGCCSSRGVSAADPGPAGGTSASVKLHETLIERIISGTTMCALIGRSLSGALSHKL